MWKGYTTDFARKSFGKSGHFVLQILSLLAEIPFRSIRSYSSHNVADTLDIAAQSVGDDGQIWWKCAVIVNEQDMGELAGDETADKLRDDLGS